MSEAWKKRIAQEQQAIEAALAAAVFEKDPACEQLWESMEYSLLAGGKRVRPLMLLLAGQSLGATREELMPFAVALEMIHTYSLIHDDLPAMDNDEYRRGRLTNHMVYGEAGAILAGDGLLNLAYETMSHALVMETDMSKLRGKILAMATLAGAAGAYGMVAGQSVDLASEGKEVSLETLQYIEKHKTGCLLTAPLVMAGNMAGIPAEKLQQLAHAGQAIGTSFQIWDDVLDVQGSFEELGKPIHSDEVNAKATFVSCFGLEKAKEEALCLTAEALECLAFLPGEEGETLRQLTEYLTTRRN